MKARHSKSSCLEKAIVQKKCISFATSVIWKFIPLSEHIAVDNSADPIRLMYN